MFKSLKREFAVMLIVFAASVILIVGSLTYFVFQNNLMNRYADEANDLANLVADILDGDNLYNYAMTLEPDDDYYIVMERLRRIKENMEDIKYLYIFVPVSDTEAIYVYDIYTLEEYSTGEVDEGELGFVEEFSEEKLGLARDIYYSNEDNDELEVSNTEYGYLASAYAPVFGADGKVKAIVGLDYSMNEITKMVSAFLIIMVIGITVVTVVATVILLVIVSKTIVEPIRIMDKKSSEYAASDHEMPASEFHIEIKNQDELKDLAQSLNQMMEDIENYIDNIESIMKEKQRIGAELSVATRIQADMLPRIFPAFPEYEEIDLYAVMDPAKEVGGDFYDFFKVDDDHIVLVMADVSGKGVPAALFMVIAKTLIKNYAQSGLPVEEVFISANNQLCEGNQDDLFVTAWIGLLEISTGKLLFSDAGHENPIIKKADGSADFIKPAKKYLPLAAWEDVHYTVNETKLESGDVLFLYTDGAPEATNKDNELFGTEKLMETVVKNSDGDMKALLEKVREEIDAFVGEADQFDDLTMLAVKIK